MANRRKYHELRRSVYLTSQQKTVVIGTVLGDGSLTETFSKNNLRLKIEHGQKQRDYVFWKYRILKPLVITPPKFQERTKSWRFMTISHPNFTEIGKLFYQSRRKIVPNNIDVLLKDPIALAVWFMDDGSKNRNDGLILNTQCFTKCETKRLQSCLNKNFAIKHVSLQQDKKGWRLYIQKASSGHMTNVIKPFVLPSMMYKLISPVETIRQLPEPPG